MPMTTLDPDPVAVRPIQSPPKPGRSSGQLGTLIFGLLIGVALMMSVGWWMLSRASGRTALSHVWSAMTGRTLTIDVSQPTVVERIQRLQRLETVVYTMDKMVTGAKQNSILPDFLAGDRLLMMVHGEVVAGIDFSELQSGEVQVNGKSVHLHLPASQIFRARLDSEKTRVYSRQTGLLVPTDPNLETQVRQEAERQIQDAALADGILKTAQQNAASTITVCCKAWALLKSASTNLLVWCVETSRRFDQLQLDVAECSANLLVTTAFIDHVADNDLPQSRAFPQSPNRLYQCLGIFVLAASRWSQFRHRNASPRNLCRLALLKPVKQSFR